MRGVYLKKGNVKVTVVPYYRIGDLFLTTNAANPSSFLGGTWQLFGPGKTLVCVDTSDSDFNTVKKTGGAKTKATGYHTLTANQSGLPYHEHYIKMRNNGRWNWWDGSEPGDKLEGGYYWDDGNVTYNWLIQCGKTGAQDAKQSHNHGNLNVVQPYITCYIWIRTA